MKKKIPKEEAELLQEVIDDCYEKLQKKCDEYCELHGKIGKYKGRIEGRKILSQFTSDIYTEIWDEEKRYIEHYNELLSYVKEEIQKLDKKIKLIEKSIK